MIRVMKICVLILIVGAVTSVLRPQRGGGTGTIGGAAHDVARNTAA